MPKLKSNFTISNIEIGEATDFYYRKYRLPYNNNSILEVKKNGDTVAILDLRENGVSKAYDIQDGFLRIQTF